MSKRHRLRNALIVANLTMLAMPTFASAGDDGALAAGLALGCCAGMAASAAINDAHEAERRRHHHRDRVVEVHHHQTPAPAPPPPAPQQIDRNEARAELAEAELWAWQHCQPMVEQPSSVKVYVTFRGQDGRATETRFTPNLRGEAFEACMARAFLRSRVSSFDKDEATVRKKLGG
ncbi:MAG TPA: hypothetical protein ENK57_19670 [Polyangiaceae bacterium]|nr:hypothetical protein [Polyangiaceae bacterium]